MDVVTPSSFSTGLKPGENPARRITSAASIRVLPTKNYFNLRGDVNYTSCVRLSSRFESRSQFIPLSLRLSVAATWPRNFFSENGRWL